MFSSKRGFDYFAILPEMDELGYDVKWQLGAARIRAYPRTGNVSILLDILEDSVPEKYFLSWEKMEQIVFL